MSYGITTVSNQSGRTVIDADYRNLEIVAEGSMPMITQVSSGTNWYFYIYDMPSVWASDAILFIKITPFLDNNISYIAQRLGNRFLIQSEVKHSFKGNPGSNPASIPYYVARPSSTINPVINTYGAAVFDGSGRTVYRSDKKYVRVKAWGQTVETGVASSFGGVGPAFQDVVDTSTDYITNSECFSPYYAYCNVGLYPKPTLDNDAIKIYASQGGFAFREFYDGNTWGTLAYGGGGLGSNSQISYLIAGPPS